MYTDFLKFVEMIFKNPFQRKSYIKICSSSKTWNGDYHFSYKHFGDIFREPP